jgi:hypothetical protein
MGMPWKGWSEIKCFLSPVMMHEAFEATASSSIMLSSESVQSVIFSIGENDTTYASIFSISFNRACSFLKYLSNFFLYTTPRQQTPT